MNLFKISALTLCASLAFGVSRIAQAAAGDPAYCYAAAFHGRQERAFRSYCGSIEAALLANGSFQHALETRQRVRAKLLFTALPNGEIAAALFIKSSGDTLIDRALMASLRRQRFTSGSSRAETFTLPIALQPVENLPAVVYRLGK